MSTTQTGNTSNTASPAKTQRRAPEQTMQPTQDIVNYVREYARQKPDVASLWCLGLGIVIGWKIKPW